MGQKPPLKPEEVWAIPTLLQIQGKRRDLALFNLPIDSKLRSCDLVALRVSDVAVGRVVSILFRTLFREWHRIFVTLPSRQLLYPVMYILPGW